MLTSARSSRWLKFTLAVGVSLFFTAYFLFSVDFDELLDALAEANYVYVPPALALFAVSLVFRALRWRYLIEPRYTVPAPKLIPPLLVGYAGNNLLPFRAGELLRVQFLAERQGVARMHAFGTLMMERLFDGMILATFLIWGLLLAGSGAGYLGLALILAGLAAFGFVICTLLARNPTFAWKLASLPLPIVGQRLRDSLGGLGESFFGGFAVLKSPSRFAFAAITTVAAWSLELGMYWLISLSFDLEASLLTIAFAGAAANVAMSLPAAQGGIGPFQAFATKALEEFGVAAAGAGAYSIALHIFLVVPVSLVGLLVLWRASLPSAQTTPATTAELAE